MVAEVVDFTVDSIAVPLKDGGRWRGRRRRPRIGEDPVDEDDERREKDAKTERDASARLATACWRAPPPTQKNR